MSCAFIVYKAAKGRNFMIKTGLFECLVLDWLNFVIMDANQAKALRHKRHIIATNIEMDENTIKEFTARRLINKLMLNNMKEEISNFCRVVKYLELLDDNTGGLPKGVFNRLCSYLEQELPWINDELCAELKTIRGELDIDGYLLSEVQQLTDEEFGPIKRLSAQEKADIKDIVATRTQHYKEVWQRTINVATEKLKKMLEALNQKDVHQRKLMEKMRQYLRVHEKVFMADADSKKQYSPQVDQEGSDEWMMKYVGQYIHGLREMSADSLQCHRAVRDEKQRALHLIKVGDVNAKLDREVDRALNPVNQELDELMSTWEKQTNYNNSLQDQLAAIEADHKRRLADDDETIRRLHGRMDDAVRSTRDLRDEMHKLQRQIAETQRMVGKYQTKATIMDSTRNLGYVNKKVVSVGRVADRATTGQNRTSATNELSSPQQLLQPMVRSRRERGSIFEVGFSPAAVEAAGVGLRQLQRESTGRLPLRGLPTRTSSVPPYRSVSGAR